MKTTAANRGDYQKILVHFTALFFGIKLNSVYAILVKSTLIVTFKLMGAS